MQYSFRLAQLLAHDPDPRKRPGTIKSIVDYTGLDRHQVAALLKNEVKYIPLKALSRLCDFLVEHGHATADQLPGALFGVEPESFWEMLARRIRLELALGVRRGLDSDSPEVSYVVASDSVLFGELLNGVTTLGGTAKHQAGTETSHREIPHPEQLKQSLVWSPGQASDDEVRYRAESVYRDFDESRKDKALVAIGSTKSNPIVELILARSFGCDPFESQDGVSSPDERSVPFFVRYRDQDPHPKSCAAGLRLSKSHKSNEPGIYYSTAPGKWEHVPASTPDHDCAFLCYVHREPQGCLEMVLGGFSGRATRLLARTLASHSQDFWPPTYVNQGVQAGAYIIKFELNPDTAPGSIDILQTDFHATTQVVAVPEETLKRCLDR